MDNNQLVRAFLNTLKFDRFDNGIKFNTACFKTVFTHKSRRDEGLI